MFYLMSHISEVKIRSVCVHSPGMLNVFEERVWSLRTWKCIILLSGCKPRLTVCEFVFLTRRVEGSKTKRHPLDHAADITELRRRKTSRRGVGEGWGRACCLCASQPHSAVCPRQLRGGGCLRHTNTHTYTQTNTCTLLTFIQHRTPQAYPSGVQATHHMQSSECLPSSFLNRNWREKEKGWHAKEAARQNRHKVLSARREARFAPLKLDLFRNEHNCQIAIIASF